MHKKLTEEVIEKMYDIGIDLNIIESLSRILLEAIREGSNLEYYDTGNLSSVLQQKIVQTSREFNLIHKILGI